MKRMKLIKIAEREDWGTVMEYASDDLADDTDDEKHLARAIKSSAAKKEKAKKRRLASNRGNMTYKKRFYKGESYRRNYNQYDYKPRGACWTCGKIGHTQRTCWRNHRRDDYRR